MDNERRIPNEQELMESIDWDHRIWPRAVDSAGIDGEWELTIRGSEEDFVAIHELLVDAGFLVDETGEYEVYARKEQP